MASKPTTYFLVLDTTDGEYCVTVACVTVKKGSTARGIRSFRRQLNDRGMWHTPIHPNAATVLLKQLEAVVPYTEVKGLSASGAAALCAAKDDGGDANAPR